MQDAELQTYLQTLDIKFVLPNGETSAPWNHPQNETDRSKDYNGGKQYMKAGLSAEV